MVGHERADGDGWETRVRWAVGDNGLNPHRRGRGCGKIFSLSARDLQRGLAPIRLLRRELNGPTR